MSKQYIGYRKAYRKTLAHIRPLPTTELLIEDCEGYVAAEDVVARVDSPSVSTSLKDGYALRAKDMTVSEDGQPAELRVIGSAAAGQTVIDTVQPGTAVRVLTGMGLGSNLHF